MKKILLICFVFIINFSFAQEKSTYKLSSFNKKKINYFSSNDNDNSDLVKYDGVFSLDLKNVITVNEGKFSLKDINNKTITSLLSELDHNSKTQFLILENMTIEVKNSSNKSSMILVINQKFINKLITAKIVQEGLISEVVNYGDIEIETYRNYAEMTDVLNAKFTISSNIELQIGNNIYPFLNKPLKMEIEKTLLNSLNLLAFNF